MLGYDVDPEAPGIPTINQEEKDLVLLIYKTYLKERGLRRTAEDMNRRGYRTKSYTSRRGKAQGGKPFTDVGISRILTNPVYIGKVRHKDKLYEGQHEPIVPVELFEKVQRTIAGNRGKRGRPQERHLFVLNGLVRCGGCGAYMTPTFSYNAQKRLYSYYACTNRNHRGTEACKTKPVPAEPLEQVIADRLIQLSNEDRTIERIVQEAMSGTDELLGNLKKRRTELKSQGRAVTEKIDALVDGIAGRRKIKSVGKRIVELEERQEQLEDEALDVDLEIQATKAKAVSAQSMTESLTTFGDLYREAIPEERRELIRLRVNQLIWTPDEIRVALLDTPPCQKFDESRQLVAQVMHSLNPC
ncbi:MAG: recombinase family protein [SAR202 cluster bacterium]|nr:recombinase family protein [SAR202 cluster bacterium]